MKRTVEAIIPNLAVFTLAAVGIKTLKLDPDQAQHLAQKLVDSHKPGFLGDPNLGNLYTRAELGALCFQYQIDCGVNLDTALDGTAANNLVQEFWENFFPHSIHTPRLDLHFEELTGDNPENIKQAESIRRRQLPDLFLLKGLIVEDYPNRELAFRHIDSLMRRNRAEDWLSTKEISYTR